ncbi:MAG TPA: hypothetical protein VD866_07170 [Urbifossiella sp.]|nr:hypothetical protein [Urbifossiella sp.]
MSGPNSIPPRPVDPVPPDDEQEPPLEGVLTAEEVEDAMRSGITFADLIRDIAGTGQPDA